MARGTRYRLSVAAVAATTALAGAAPAGAQEGGEDPFSPLFFTDTLEYTRTQAGKTAGLLYVNDLQSGSNRQGVTGYLGGAPFTGVAVNHLYEKKGDKGHYSLSGWLYPAGEAPVPVSAAMTLNVDRTANVGKVSVNGNLGDEPVQYVSSPIVIPPGVYGLGGLVPLF